MLLLALDAADASLELSNASGVGLSLNEQVLAVLDQVLNLVLDLGDLLGVAESELLQFGLSADVLGLGVVHEGGDISDLLDQLLSVSLLSSSLGELSLELNKTLLDAKGTRSEITSRALRGGREGRGFRARTRGLRAGRRFGAEELAEKRLRALRAAGGLGSEREDEGGFGARRLGTGRLGSEETSEEGGLAGGRGRGGGGREARLGALRAEELVEEGSGFGARRL